jgi:hypothetical protein
MGGEATAVATHASIAPDHDGMVVVTTTRQLVGHFSYTLKVIATLQKGWCDHVILKLGGCSCAQSPHLEQTTGVECLASRFDRRDI